MVSAFQKLMVEWSANHSLGLANFFCFTNKVLLESSHAYLLTYRVPLLSGFQRQGLIVITKAIWSPSHIYLNIYDLPFKEVF